MAIIRPFAALRPKPELAAHICELPYDVMSSEEARQIASGNPLSFLHVSKPEIDLPPDTDIYAPEVYAKGKENFAKLIRDGALRRDAQACFYFYRQIMNQRGQVGLVAVASCEEYLHGTIKKHELTRPDKEEDRLRHITALDSQTGPVFLTYRAVAAIDELTAKKITEPPDIDFTAIDGVRHTAWVVRDPATVQLIEGEFARIPSLYIADGHHRSAAAARVYQQRRSSGRESAQTSPAETHSRRTPAATNRDQSGKFLAVVFPHNQVQILPYNRALKDFNSLTPDAMLQRLDSVFIVEPNGAARPKNQHELGFYLGKEWHTLRFRPRFLTTTDPIEKLDVALLQKNVLGPLFGIDDPRTSKRIHFVGGIRGTAELEKLVNRGEYACAFSMFPTSIEDLMTVADAGGIMPPKSTWFEPKLRDAIFCHMI